LSSVNFKNNNAAVFISCFLIAIFFWTITALNKLYVTTISIPVVYNNIPLSFRIEKPLPSEIFLDIQAKGFDLISDDFSKKNKRVTIDFNSLLLRKIGLNTHTSFPSEKLLEQFISFNDPAYKIVKVQPDSIVLDYTKKFTVKVPVKLNAELNYRKQYFNTIPSLIRPDSIEISGPPQLLSNITAIETQKTIFNDIRTNLFFSVPLINPFRDKIILQENKVWVAIPVEEFTEGKVKVALKKFYYQNKQIVLIPDNIEITYHVALKNYSSISPDDFEVEVSPPVINENESKLRVTVIKNPKAIQIVAIHPESVDYLIEK
jgi:hypothetical protein